MSKRPRITPGSQDRAISRLAIAFANRLDQKSDVLWCSRHEILGVVQEEVHELEEAVHQKNVADMEGELTDIAVACIMGILSIRSNALDW